MQVAFFRGCFILYDISLQQDVGMQEFDTNFDLWKKFTFYSISFLYSNFSTHIEFSVLRICCKLINWLNQFRELFVLALSFNFIHYFLLPPHYYVYIKKDSNIYLQLVYCMITYMNGVLGFHAKLCFIMKYTR